MNKLILALNKISGIDVESLLSQLKEANEEVESLKKQADKNHAYNGQLESQIEELKQEIQNKSEEIVSLKAELESRIAQADEASKNHSDLLEKYRQLTEANTEIQNKILSLQADIETAHAQIEQFKNECAALNKNHDTLNIDYQKLHSDYDVLQKEHATLQANHSSLQISETELQHLCSEQKEQIAALESVNESLKSASAELQSQFSSLKSDANSLKTDNVSLHEKLAAMKEELQQKTDECISWNQQNTENKQRLDDLQDQYNSLQVNFETMKAADEHKLAEEKEMQNSLQMELSLLQKKLSEQEALLNREKQAMTEMESRLDAEKQKVMQQAQDLSTQNNQNQALEQQFATQKQLYVAQTQQMKQLSQKIEQQATLLKEKDTLLLKFQTDLEKQKQLLQQTQQQQKEQQTAIQDELAKQNAELKKSLDEKDQKLIESQSEIDAYRQKFVHMETERVRLLQEIASFKEHPGVPEKAQAPDLPQWMSHEGNCFVNYGQPTKLSYQGIFHGHNMEQEDSEHYPYSREPMYQSQVAAWTDRAQLPVGLSGRLLEKGLQLLEKLDIGIHIRTRATLPVDGTQWGIHPDILIEWAEQELYVAVHVDAPYDLRTGAPLHDSASFTDEWINYYYTSHGACVVRIAEEQVVEDYEQVLAYLSNYLYEQTGDLRLMQHVSWGVTSPLWNSEGAQMAAMHHYREQYLGNELLSEVLALDKNMPLSIWKELPFSIEQLPAEAEKLAALQKAVSQRYVVVTTRPYGSQIVFLSNQMQHNQLSLRGTDQIKNIQVEVPFWTIETLEGRSDIDKPIERSQSLDLEHLQALLADAVCQYHPVIVQYKGNNGSMQQTVLYWLTFASLRHRNASLPYGDLFQDLITDSVNPEILVGMSAAHHQVMQIALRDIRSIRVLDLFVTERAGIGALVNGMYCAVLYQQASLAEMLYNHLPADVKPMPYVQINYAHLCMLKQNYKQAYTIYSSIPPQRYMQENATWEDMVTNDFTELIKNDVEPQLFIRMAHDLNRVGWHFE